MTHNRSRNVTQSDLKVLRAKYSDGSLGGWLEKKKDKKKGKKHGK